MADGWLSATHSSRPGLDVLGGILLALAFLLFAPQPEWAVHTPPRVHVIDGDIGLEALSGPDVPGRLMPYRAIERPEGIAWLVWDDVPLADDDAPPAVGMIGPFSATVFLNGRPIGHKGTPGATARTETAGPIDSLFAVPADLIRPEGNRIAVRLSSQRAGYRPYSVVQGLFVTPYTSDPRRSIRYYLPLVLMGGSLIALMAAFGLRTRETRDRRGLWLVAALGGLILAGTAEISRSLINYPYDWHQPRQALSLAGLVLFSGAWLRFAQLRWPRPARIANVWLGVSLLAVLVSVLAVTGYDGKSALATAVLVASAALWLGWRGGTPERLVAAGLLIVAGYALWQPADIIDRGIYAFALALLGITALRHRHYLLPQPDHRVAKFALETSGRTVLVDPGEIAYLKAAGNYTEVHMTSGGTHWDNRNLSKLLDALPDAFFRLHRSYAVNLDQAAAVTSAEGSRYHLETSAGARIPVSRSRVAELRRRIGHT
ncbi:MAG: LytTR family DNA-binding domain-containing protein [Pseudomonadota bacterium]|nr:LytTR family DNA-binding domain-containing protein [Pseudomonadota bacterium]